MASKNEISLKLFNTDFEVLDLDDKNTALSKIKIKCTDCENDSSYIDHKGFIYCEDHGYLRQQSTKCRKMKQHEINRIKNGKQIEKY